MTIKSICCDVPVIGEHALGYGICSKCKKTNLVWNDELDVDKNTQIKHAQVKVISVKTDVFITIIGELPNLKRVTMVEDRNSDNRILVSVGKKIFKKYVDAHFAEIKQAEEAITNRKMNVMQGNLPEEKPKEDEISYPE